MDTLTRIALSKLFYLELEKRILPELRLGSYLARLIYDYPRIRSLLFRLYGQNLTEAVTDIMMGEKTYRSILHNPLNYLKMLRLWELQHAKKHAV